MQTFLHHNLVYSIIYKVKMKEQEGNANILTSSHPAIYVEIHVKTVPKIILNETKQCDLAIQLSMIQIVRFC